MFLLERCFVVTVTVAVTVAVVAGEKGKKMLAG